ncbi:MBL fold metallo-hydrolase [Botrimarina sp.]|uniref:MBL fold metallo-hydrolase n=1 Tax=Botrimarina sp. TaxID=2795802 RepID=UPI0032ED3B1E
MLQRTPLFPNVIELNHQARRRVTCSVYLIYDDDAWALIDIGYEDAVDEVLELIRQLDFPFSRCVTLIASHADVDHIQGLAKAKQILKTQVACHPVAAKKLESGDRIATFAHIGAQGIDLPMPPVKCERLVEDGDVIRIGGLELEVWHTPGHTDGQLAFRLGELLFSGDNLFRDGSVGVIDAHHGSNLEDFVRSLRRIRDSDVRWLLPSHGPAFRKDDRLIDATIARLEGYQHLADFGTCATGWPLMQQWEKELVEGRTPE